MKVFGIVGWKNSGKTGLMERLVTEIVAREFSVSTLKHAHHNFDVDMPGKDSFRHRAAGATEVVISSRHRWVLMNELRGEVEPELADLLGKLEPVDLILVEGFKAADIPKLEAYRGATENSPIANDDDGVRAVASDVKLEIDVPVFDLDATAQIADFILAEVGLS